MCIRDSTISGLTALSASDILEAHVFDTFAIATMNAVPISGGTFTDSVNVSGTLTANSFSGDGSALTNLPMTGGTFTGNVEFHDNIKATFGTGADFEIFHSGSSANIKAVTGHLEIRAMEDNHDIFLITDSGSGSVTNYVHCDGGTGEVKLNHYGSQKLATKSTGVTVNGALIATSFTGDGSGLTNISGGTGGSTAADDITTGDAAVTLTTTSGNVTVTAQGSNELELNGALVDINATNGDIDITAVGGNVDLAGNTGPMTFTNTGSANIIFDPDTNGYGVEIKGNNAGGYLQLNCEANSHGVKIQSPDHVAAQSYTLKLPDNQVAANKVLKVKSITGSGATAVGQLEFADESGGMPTTGGTFTGDVTFSGDNYNLLWDKSTDDLKFDAGSQLQFKNSSGSNGFRMYQLNDHSYIMNETGTFNIFQSENDSDVIIYSDDSTGGFAMYFRADGSSGETQLFHYGSEKLATKSTGVAITGVLTLGGSLDVNGNEISSASNNNVVVNPNGSGTIKLNASTTLEDGTHNFDVASHDGTNGLMLGGNLVTSSATELNKLDGTSVTTAELDKLNGYTGTTTDLNRLDLGTGQQLGIFKVQTSVPNNANQFTGNTKIIMVY